MGRVMFFLLRLAFWFGLVCVLLPNGGSKPTSPDAHVSASEAVTLASAAVTDARGFCGRQPQACVVGGKVINALGHRAEAGARTLYTYITAHLNGSPPSGGKGASRIVTNLAPGDGTLTTADLQPRWRNPVLVPLPPRRQVRAGRPSA